MIDQDLIPNQILDLRNISEEVEEFIMTERIIKIAGPEYTVEDLLRACYSIILDELKAIGLVFLFDDEILMTDWYSCGKIFLLRRFFDRATFVSFLTQSAVARDRLVFLLDHSDESFNIDSLRDLVDLLIETYPNDKQYETIRESLDEMTITEDFVSYLNECRNDILGDPTAEILDEKKAAEYVSRIKKNRDIVSEVIDVMLIDLDNPIPDRDKLRSLIRQYDIDKVRGDQLKIYSVIDRDDVEPCLSKYKQEMMDIHHKRSPHHVDYWVNKGSAPSDITSIMMLVAACYTPTISPDEFETAVRNLLTDKTAFPKYPGDYNYTVLRCMKIILDSWDFLPRE